MALILGVAHLLGRLSSFHALMGTRTPQGAVAWIVSLNTFPLISASPRAGGSDLPGFMHQKVFLVDDVLAGVGTANFDNRSFRLNFEVTALVADQAFAGEVERMLERTSRGPDR